MIKLKFLFLGLFFLATIASAQEICNDGIDNDGDGFIDCFDSDCASSPDCDGFYIGNDVSCEAQPSEFPEFSLTLDFASPDKSANHLGRIAVGDLDRDGIPEIISQNWYTGELFILNGNDGTVKKSIKVSNGRPDWRVAVANIDDDDCGEIFTVLTKGSNFYLAAFDCNLNELWRSEARSNDPLHISLADFDGDGLVELFYKDEIRDAKTGVKIIGGDSDNWKSINGGPVAVDILGDGNLEMVSGATIYSVNLGSRTAGSGSLTSLKSRPEYRVKRQENTTSIADYNQDGFLDVITTGKDSDGITTVFFWDIHNDALKTYADPIEKVDKIPLNCSADSGDDMYKKGWIVGTGRLNIGDLNGNGTLNVSFVSGRFLYALDENFELLWRVVVNEETSGHTGCTLFDFNGDGKMEVVYRDEQWLFIINGVDGTVFTQQRCISRTNVEYPIVADVDADGSTELCLVCGTDDEDSWDNFCELSYSENSQVRVYKSNSEPWVPARRVWNQHGYFNVNINDDLTIPRIQQKHHLVWSTGSCTTGPNRPLNGFLNQSPFLNSQGCPTYASPDLSFVDNSLVIVQPNCPETNFNVSFQIQNQGDLEITGDVPISFYNGDPLLAGATKLSTVTVTLNRFKVGNTLAVNDITITGPGSPFSLYVVLNDNGSTVPTPISMPNTNFLECDYENNILMGLVNPIPFPLSTAKTDNITCVGTSVPASGSARAFRLVGGVENTTDYIFNWFDGTAVTATPDFQGAIYSGLSAGTYSVFATHKSAFCNSDTVQVTIADVSKDISAEIIQERANDRCNNYNGKLKVVVNGGEPVGKFTYAWYEGNTVGGGLVISTSQIANNLNSILYTVLVTEKSTGCQTVRSMAVDDESVTPIVTATASDINCSDTNTGILSANVAGIVSGYTFNWYIGSDEKASADWTGSTVNGRSEGTYTVVAMDNDTKCKSAPVTVTISKTIPPVASATKLADNTSCDDLAPNGSASATANGTTTGFSFEWFSGQNTLAGNLKGKGSTITGLGAGVYTVKATDNVTGCSHTTEVTISKVVVIPVLTLTKTNITQCVPLNGSISAAVSTGDIADYTFSWYNGSNVKATPDYDETGHILSNLEPGTYTVKAVNNLGCIADAKTETITAPVIAMAVTSTIPPLDCSTESGEIEVTIDPATGNYRVEWFLGNVDPASATPIFVEENVSVSTATGLISQNYTVLATNIATGCEVKRVIFLPQLNGQELELDNHAAATICTDNNGQITADLEPATTYATSDYMLELYEGSTINGAPFRSQNAGTSQQFTDLPSGYYVLTVRPINGAPDACVPPEIVVEIDFIVSYPDVTTKAKVNNTFCDENGAIPTGEIEIEINGGAPAGDFIIQWFEGEDTSVPLNAASMAGVNNERAINLTAGFYTVSVTDNVTFLACNTTRTYEIVNDKPVITLPTAGLDITNVISCSAAGNGSLVTITDMMENGASVDIANYTFEWYDNNNNILPDATTPNTSNQIGNLPAGTYYVLAENIVNSCESTLREFVIEDNTIGDPSIDLVSIQHPTRCMQPVGLNVSGELHVNASGTGADFAYQWYEGATATGAIIDSDADLTDRQEGTYTVQVENLTTNCTAVATYTLVLETGDIQITANATPLTNCEIDDGSLFATVTSGFSNNYTYNWSEGTTVRTPADYTGKNVAGRTIGDYTVQAVDQSDATCFSEPITVTIDREQIIPNLSVEQKAPLTVCDLTRADGTAMATVDGGYVGYTFQWYEGTSASGTPIYTGSEFFGMKAMTYTVVATDNVNLCSAEQSVTIEENIPSVPDPTIEILAHDTHCIIDNGALSVSVNGNTSDYIFHWYIGTDVKDSPDFIGEIFTELGAGFYTVTSTSKVTGCVSNPVTEEIIEILNYPEFEFVIGNANCDQNNGYIRLITSNDVELESIIWTGSNLSFPVSGPNLSEVSYGIYTVTVVTARGCEVSEELEVGTEINPYNGISRNGDGNNDRFKIDCINEYPDNIVKIFNRAGTQVFEAEGYNNDSKYFDGISNKGLSIMGSSLPDGTYFYVIDKRDGSKPMAGYLEIVN